MRTGTYRTITGELVFVRATDTGYVIRYTDGRTVTVSK